MTHKLGNMHSVFVGGLYKYREKCKNLFSDKAAGFSVGEISHDHRIRETPSSMIPWDVMWCLSKHFKLSGPGGKGPTHQCRRHKRHGFHPWVGKIPWRRKWQPTAVFLPEGSHGQRSLAGYSPWGCKESDMTEVTCGALGVSKLNSLSYCPDPLLPQLPSFRLMVIWSF